MLHEWRSAFLQASPTRTAPDARFRSQRHTLLHQPRRAFRLDGCKWPAQVLPTGDGLEVWAPEERKSGRAEMTMMTEAHLAAASGYASYRRSVREGRVGAWTWSLKAKLVAPVEATAQQRLMCWLLACLRNTGRSLLKLVLVESGRDGSAAGGVDPLPPRPLKVAATVRYYTSSTWPCGLGVLRRVNSFTECPRGEHEYGWDKLVSGSAPRARGRRR